MRSVVQSLLARHPAYAGVGVGVRWIAWLLAGHPFGPTFGLLALVIGLPWWQCVAAFGVVEGAIGLWGFAGLTTGAESVYLWGHLCRFRRRWPGEFAKAYTDHRLVPVIARNHYSVPGGLRPVLAGPQLSLLPRAFDRRTIGWRLLPRPGHNLHALVTAVEQLAIADDRIASASVRAIRGAQLALIVTFERPGGGRSSRFPTGLADLPTPDGDGGIGLGPLGSDPFAPGTSDPPPGTHHWNQRQSRRRSPCHHSDYGQLNQRPGRRRAEARVDQMTVAGVVEGPSVFDDRGDNGWPFGSGGGVGSGHDPGWGSGIGWRGRGGSSVGSSGSDGQRAIVADHPRYRRRFPLPWSFSVIVPANVVVGATVWLTDAGPVAVVALCTGCLISVVLIIAEAVGRR